MAAIWFLLPDTLPQAMRTRIGFVSVLIRYAAILRERVFITHALVGAFTMSALFAYLAATPQIFVVEYGWSTSGYALLFGVNAMAYIGYNQLNPALVQRFGIAPVITIAGSILLLACLVLTVLAWAPRGPFAIVAALLLSEAGFGLVQPCAMVGALSRHQAHAGSASALLGTMQYTGGAIAGLAMGWLADGTSKPMAVAMLLCASGAMLAGLLRPRVSFARAES